MNESAEYTSAERQRLDRALGPVEGVCIVVGTVIGSGIFLTPKSIAEGLGSFGFGTILCVWILCGLLSLAGALAYAELSAMFPRSGGQYVFLREAYGPLWGFLFGWMEFWVARAGSIATVAVAFAQYAGYFTHHLDPWSIRWTAFLAVFILTMINYVGVRWGGAVQVLFTATKVAALGALVVCAFGLPGGSAQNWMPLWGSGGSWTALVRAFGIAMVASLWAYDGWANGATVAEEMKEPQRNVPRALVLGTLLVTVIYVLANLAYHYVLPVGVIATSDAVAARTGEVLFGTFGGGLIAAAVMISTFGSINGMLLTGPRIFFAMARDRIFFPEMAELHPKFHTPHLALVFQGLWACLLVLVPFDSLADALFRYHLPKPLYDQLFDYVIFASWLFYGMTVAGVLVLRRSRPEHPRSYRTFGYPVVPLLFVLVAALFVLHTLFTQYREALAGLVIIVLGLPAYRAWSRRASTSPLP